MADDNYGDSEVTIFFTVPGGLCEGMRRCGCDYFWPLVYESGKSKKEGGEFPH